MSPLPPAIILAGEIPLLTPIHTKGQSYFSDTLSQKDTEINFHQCKSDAITLKQLDVLQFKMSWNQSMTFI